MIDVSLTVHLPTRTVRNTRQVMSAGVVGILSAGVSDAATRDRVWNDPDNRADFETCSSLGFIEYRQTSNAHGAGTRYWTGLSRLGIEVAKQLGLMQ